MDEKNNQDEQWVDPSTGIELFEDPEEDMGFVNEDESDDGYNEPTDQHRVSHKSGSSLQWRDVCSVAQMVYKWAYRLRSVLLAIPVVVAAITLAIRNMARLPAKVGLDMLASGEFQFVVSKSIAVLGPLAVTAVCLLLMFASRKVIYPWLISVFSLLLPAVIYWTNVFPA